MKLVIFDCDGTLVDGQHKIVDAMVVAYAAQGLPAPTREQVLSIVGLSLAEAFTVLGEGNPGFPVAAMVERYKEAAGAMRAAQTAWEPLFPGARETIEALAAAPDVIVGMATGKSRRGVDAVMGAYGLLDRFITIQTADRAPSKPHPGMVLQAMAETGAEPHDTVVIGDSIYDMQMARAAGAFGLGVSWGYNPPAALLQSGASAVLSDFTALSPALAALWPDLTPLAATAEA